MDQHCAPHAFLSISLAPSSLLSDDMVVEELRNHGEDALYYQSRGVQHLLNRIRCLLAFLLHNRKGTTEKSIVRNPSE